MALCVIVCIIAIADHCWVGWFVSLVLIYLYSLKDETRRTLDTWKLVMQYSMRSLWRRGLKSKGKSHWEESHRIVMWDPRECSWCTITHRTCGMRLSCKSPIDRPSSLKTDWAMVEAKREERPQRDRASQKRDHAMSWALTRRQECVRRETILEQTPNVLIDFSRVSYVIFIALELVYSSHCHCTS